MKKLTEAMKNLVSAIKNRLIVKLGGYTEKQYISLIESQNDCLSACAPIISGLVEALKDSNVLDTFGGVRYSYSLCKYCWDYPHCNKECKHGENFVFARCWKERMSHGE